MPSLNEKPGHVALTPAILLNKPETLRPTGGNTFRQSVLLPRGRQAAGVCPRECSSNDDLPTSQGCSEIANYFKYFQHKLHLVFGVRRSDSFFKSSPWTCLEKERDPSVAFPTHRNGGPNLQPRYAPQTRIKRTRSVHRPTLKQRTTPAGPDLILIKAGPVHCSNIGVHPARPPAGPVRRPRPLPTRVARPTSLGSRPRPGGGAAPAQRMFGVQLGTAAGPPAQRVPAAHWCAVWALQSHVATNSRVLTGV